MADLSALTPEQISAATKAFEALNTAHPVLGITVAVIGLLATIVTLINNFRTKKNTEAHGETAKLLADHEAKMIAIKDEAIRDVRGAVTELQESVKSSRAQIMEESEKFALRVMKLQEDTRQKLSFIPKFQDAVMALEKKQLNEEFKNAQRDERIDKFIAGLEKLRKGEK